QRWVFGILIYLIFLGFGFVFGGYFSISAHEHLNRTPIPTIRELAPQQTTSAKTYPVPTLPQYTSSQTAYPQTQSLGQINYLLVTVDDLTSSHPQLTSLWLWIIDKNANQWMFLPLYDPEVNSSISKEFAQQLVTSFSIKPDHQLDGNFLKLIQDHSILWHHSIIVDDVLLSKLGEIVQVEQFNLLNSAKQICKLLPQENLDITPLDKLSPTHFYADQFPSFLIQTDMTVLKSLPVQCSFPTLP
ncbi:MAG: hypothetical protein ACPL4H_03450, partial [Anaerolineales bacterium]